MAMPEGLRRRRGPGRPASREKSWSRRPGLNRRPTDYESVTGSSRGSGTQTVAAFLATFKARYAPLSPRPEYYAYPCRVIKRLLGAVRLRDVDAQAIERFRARRLREGASR